MISPPANNGRHFFLHATFQRQDNAQGAIDPITPWVVQRKPSGSGFSRCYHLEMRTSLTRFAAVSSFVLAIVASHTAHAKTGYTSGYTGAPGSKSCGGCHNGGAATTLAVSGPATLAAGQTGDYTATLSGGPGTKTFGASVVGGSISPVGGNMKTAGTEVFSTHDKVATGTFQFKITAPASGSVTLYYMGLASDGSGEGGDKNVQMSKTITVTSGGGGGDAGTPKTDAGTTTSEDGGTPIGGDDGGGVVDPAPTSGGTDDTGTVSDPGSDEDGDGGTSGMKSGNGILPSGEPESCSFSTRGSPSGAAVIVAAIGLLLARRRRSGS